MIIDIIFEKILLVIGEGVLEIDLPQHFCLYKKHTPSGQNLWESHG